MCKTGAFYKNRPVHEPEAVAELAEDQYFIRQELKRLELVSFVADGAILPRESGISSRPMKTALPFLPLNPCGSHLLFLITETAPAWQSAAGSP